MIKNLLIATALILGLSACSVTDKVFNSASTGPQKVAQLEATYTAVLETIVLLREPCKVPEAIGVCVIEDDAVYAKILKVQKKGSKALDKLKTFSKKKNPDAINTYRNLFDKYFAELKDILAPFKGRI
jgi:hypothetical protein